MKKYSYNFVKLFFLFSLALLFQSCLKDNISEPLSISIADNIKLLGYLEDKMDNITNYPPIVTPDEVNSNLSSFLLLDIRSSSDYVAGHIPGAINLRTDSLLNYLQAKTLAHYSKIIIIDNDGQSSAYFTALLRLYGIDNIYSLKLGMSQWNRNFSNLWDKKLGGASIMGGDMYHQHSQNKLSPLPDIQLDNSGADIETKAKKRIAKIIDEGFNSGMQFVEINYTTGSTSYQFGGENSNSFYIICYGDIHLFQITTVGIITLRGSYLYEPSDNLLSISQLQTLPIDQRIVVYSISGINSAFINAYLRILGYDSKTMLYGACTFVYSEMLTRNIFYNPFLYRNQDVRNFPYNTGSNP